MKNLLFPTLVLLLVSWSAAAQSGSSEKKNAHAPLIYHFDDLGTNQITIDITKLKSDEGKVMLQLMDANEKPLISAFGWIKDNTSKIVIDSVPSGSYAIRYFHDKNNNNKMDFNFMGIPTEGYGFSNNARGFMGEPDVKDMLFDVNEDITMQLKTAN